MKEICLIRHAKSSWDDPLLADFDRPLNERGKKDAPRMAKRFKEREIALDLLYTSPARRARKTCRLFAKVLGFSKSAIRLEEGLYHAGEDTLMRFVLGLDDKQDTVAIFGHNPGLTEFANLLTHSGIVNIPTTGIVHIRFAVNRWKDILPGKGKVVFFDFPKKHDRKEK